MRSFSFAKKKRPEKFRGPQESSLVSPTVERLELPIANFIGDGLLN